MKLCPAFADTSTDVLTGVLVWLTIAIIFLTFPIAWEALTGNAFAISWKNFRRARVQRGHRRIDHSGFASPPWDWHNPHYDCEKFIDPRGDAFEVITRETLRIGVPAKVRDLWPGTNFDAPRLLIPFSTDFVCTVRVTTDFAGPVQGAGILVWHDRNNFWRLNRIFWRSETYYQDREEYVSLEGCVDGVYTTAENKLLPAGRCTGSLDLKLQYTSLSREIRGYYRLDGRQGWKRMVGATFYPGANFKVGVFVMNNPKTGNIAIPCSATFERFTLHHL